MQSTASNTTGATKALGAVDDLLEVGESSVRFIVVLISYKTVVHINAEAPLPRAQ